MPSTEILIEILKMLNEVFKGFTLRAIIGIVLQISEPDATLLPMNVFD